MTVMEAGRNIGQSEASIYAIGIITVVISYVSVDDLHVLQKPSRVFSHDKLLIPGLLKL